MIVTNDKLEAALGYARRGWGVFPLHTPVNGACSCELRGCDNPGKHPRFDLDDLEHGVNSASTNEVQIRTWWERWPDANVGVAMGGESGVFALDIDPRNDGEANLDVWLKQHGPLPETMQALTGGGGFHHFFNHPGWYVQGRSGKNALAPGVEVKGDGGYVVAPPSTHVLGLYRWEASTHFGDMGLADAPGWLLALLKPSTNGKRESSVVDSLIPQGERNDTLTSLAGTMRRRGMTVEAIEAALLVTNAAQCVPQLPDRDIRRIAESVGRYKPDEAKSWRVGAKGTEFTGIDPLRKIGTDPPRYEATVLNSKLELTALDLVEFKRFKFTCITKLGFIPMLPRILDADGKPLRPQSVWEKEFLKPALERSAEDRLFEEAPEDAGAFGAAWQSVMLFFKRVQVVTDKDGIFDDRLYEEEQTYIFRGRQLRKWLQTNKMDRLREDELWAAVRAHGGKPVSVRTAKGVVKAWLVPRPEEETE